MSRYKPNPPPISPNDVARWADDELNKVGISLSQQFDNEPVWERIVVDGNAVKPHPTGSKPDFSEMVGLIHLYSFDGGLDEEVHFSCLLGHGWKEGSTIIPIVRWTCSTATVGATVIWELHRTFANIGGTFAANITASATTSVSASLRVYETTLGAITANTSLMNVNLLGRLIRRGIADTYNADVGLLGIDFLIQKDGLGSVKRGSKL